SLGSRGLRARPVRRGFRLRAISRVRDTFCRVLSPPELLDRGTGLGHITHIEKRVEAAMRARNEGAHPETVNRFKKNPERKERYQAFYPEPAPGQARQEHGGQTHPGHMLPTRGTE